MKILAAKIFVLLDFDKKFQTLILSGFPHLTKPLSSGRVGINQVDVHIHMFISINLNCTAGQLTLPVRKAKSIDRSEQRLRFYLSVIFCSL